MEVTPVNARDADEIERNIAAFARAPNGGLIVTGSALAQVHRDLIITLAARYKLPAVYFEHLFATAGLPVQAPTEYELVTNLKTAKALGITIQAPLLARAAGVIE